MLSWLAVGLQAVLAAAGLLILARRVWPRLGHLRHPALLLDVWGPLALVGPFLFAAGRVDGPVAGPGWVALAGPVLAAAIGAGAALWLRRPADSRSAIPAPMRRGGFACAGAAVLLVLLAAAHDLTTSVGQASLAAAAVLLWINTPATGDHENEPSAASAQAGVGMLLALGCATGQGVASLFAAPAASAASDFIMLAYAATGLALVSRASEAGAWERVAGWSAALGVLLAIGLTSLVRLVPRIPALLGGAAPGDVEGLRRVAYGFGRLAPEAGLLLALGALLSWGGPSRMAARRWIGGGLVGAGLWVVLGRLAAG